MRIDCQDCKRKEATQLKPYPLCDRCWAVRFSVQYVDGEFIPFIEMHKARLKGLNLWKKAGESSEDWGKRCKQFMETEQRTL
jgi:hypothetical protein